MYIHFLTHHLLFIPILFCIPVSFTPIPTVPLYHYSQDVEQLGKAGEVLSVKPGRARNHLIPSRLALPKSEQNLEQARGLGLTILERSNDDESTTKSKSYFDLQADIIRNMGWFFHRSPVNSTDNHVTRPVTKDDILTKLRSGKLYFVDKNEILFPEGFETLNHLGTWPVAVGVHAPDTSDWVRFDVVIEKSETVGRSTAGDAGGSDDV